MKIKIKSPSRELQTLPFPYRTPEATAGIDSVFLTSFDIYKCEEPDPSVTIHTPFLSLTVGLAAVVHEPSIVTLWPSINDSILELQKKSPENHISIICHQLQSTSSDAAGQCWQITRQDSLLPSSSSSKTQDFQGTKTLSQTARTVPLLLSGKQSLPVASVLDKHPSTLPRQCLWFQALTSA